MTSGIHPYGSGKPSEANGVGWVSFGFLNGVMSVDQDAAARPVKVIVLADMREF